MRVDAEHTRERSAWRRRRDRRAGHAGAAAEVDDHAAIGRDARARATMCWTSRKWIGTVIQRERRALAGAVERLVIGERGFAPLDIRRRQRPQARA